MPATVPVAAFVAGVVFLLIALLGGGFELFGAKIINRVGKGERLGALVVAVILIYIGLANPFDRTVNTPSSAGLASPAATSVSANADTQPTSGSVAITSVATSMTEPPAPTLTFTPPSGKPTEPPTIVATPEPPTPAPTKQPDLIFEDTFDNGIRPDWKILNDDPLTVDGLLTASSGWLTIEYGDSSLKNFAIDFESEGGGQLIVVIGGKMRITYAYGYGSGWDKFVNGNWQHLADAPNIGANKHVRIIVKGKSYTVDINNGQQEGSVTSSVEGQGPIQLNIQKDRYVDSFSVTTLP